MNDPARILVVDDTPMNVKLLEGVLAGHGFAVTTASSGAAAQIGRAAGGGRVLSDVELSVVAG